MTENIHVLVRVRPSLPHEPYVPPSALHRDDAAYLAMHENEIVVDGRHYFSFDTVLDMDCTSEHISRVVCDTLVRTFLDGVNASALTYGQTGAGKTHTMNALTHDVITRLFDALPSLSAPPPCSAETSSVIAVAAAAATENRSGTAAQHVPLSQPSASASSLVSPLSCSSSLLSPTSTPAPAYVLLASVLEVYQEHVYDLLAAAVQHPGQSHNRATSSTPVSGSTATAYHLHPSASTMHTDGNNHSSSMHLSSSNINVHTSTTSHNHNNNCASNTNSSLGGMSSKSSGSGLRLRLREDPTHGVYVCGLTEHPVQSAEELHRLVRCATASRATAATMNNATSSRSHCVVTLTLHNRGTSSRLFLVDLAGSERLKKLTTGLPSASCSVSLPAGQQRQPRRVGGADGGDMPSTQVPPYRNNPGSDNSHNHCSSNRYEMHVRSFGSDELIDTMSNETCLVSPAAHASCAVNRNSSRFHSPTRAHTCSLSKHTSNSNPCEGVGASVHSHSNGTGSSSSSHFARRVSRDEFAREYRDARLREGISVNSGLLALGNVIHSLYAHKAHIPFRSSVLTRILQPSLAGHGRTVMLACISPHDSDRAETISTLKYAHRVKSLKTTPRVAVSSFRSSEQVQQTITALRQEMAELHRQLATLMAVCSLQQQQQQQQKQKQKEASSRSVSVAALSSSALLCPMVTPASPTTSHTLHHADPRDSRNNTIDASTYTHTHKGYVAADGNRNTDPANDNNEEGKEESMRAQRADSYLSLAPTTFDNSSADHSRGCRMPYMAHKVTATASVSPASATVAPLLTECVTEPPAHVAQPILARQQQQQSGSQIEPGERARPHSPSLTCTPQASQQYTSVLEQLLEQERTTTRRLEEELFRAEYAAMVELEKRRTFEQRVRELERSVGAPAETATKTNTDNHSTGNNDADATTPTSPTTYGTIAMANGVDDNPCTATHVDTDKTREGLLHESSTAALVKGAVRADLRAAPALRDGRRESPRHRTSPASVGMHRGTSSARRDTSRTTGNATLRYGHTNSSRVRSNSHYTDSSLHMQSPIGARRLRSSSALSAKAAAAEEKVEVGRNARATGSPAQRRRSSSGLCNIRRTERNEARPSCSFASSSSASAAGEAKRSVLKSSASKAPPSSCASTSSLLMASSQACAQGESARQPLLRSLTRSSSASLYARDTVNHEKTNTPHAMAVAPDEAHPWNRKDCPNSAAQVCASTHTGPYTRAAVGQKRSTSTIDATVQAFAVSAALDDGSSANNQWEASHSTHANKHNNNSSNHKEVNECMSLSIDSLHATETPQRGQEVVKKSPMFASLLLPVQLPSYYHRQHNDGGDDSHNTHGGIGTHDTTSRMTGAMTTTTTATTAAAVVAASSNANASPPMLERTARKDNSRVSPGRRTSCAMDAGSAARSHSNSIRSRSRSSNSPCPSSRKSHNSHQGRSCSVVAARRVGSARQTRSTRRRSVSSMCGASRDGMDVYSQSAERAGGGGGGEGEGDLTTPARAAAAVPTATRTLDCTTTTPGTHQSLPVSTTPHRQSRGRRTATSSVMDGDASCLGSMHARSASAADRVEQNRRVCQMSSELMTTPSQQHNCAEKRHGVSPTARHATDTQERLTSSIFVPSMLTSPAPADSVGATVAIAPTPGRVDVAVFGKERPHEVRVATMHETLCGTTSSSNSSNSSVMHRCNDGSEDEHENEVEAGETCANRGDVILCDAKPMALAMQLPTTRATAGSEMDMQQDAQERKDIIDEEPHHVVDLEAASEAAAAAAAAAMRETIVVTVLPSGESLPGLLPQADDEEEEHAMCALSRLERELQELTGYRRVLCRLSGENAVRWRQMREALQQRRATLQLLLQASPLGERARAEREKELAELQEKLQPLESMDSLLLRTPGQLRELDTRLAELHSLREHQLRKIELHQGREQTRVQTEDGLGSREALLADGPTREGMSSSNNNSKNEDNNNTSDNKSKNCFCSNILNCSASNSIRTIRSYNSNASIHTSISSSSRSSTAVSGNVSSHICDFNDVNSCATATRSSRSNNMRHIRDKDARVPNETSTSATGIGNSEANASQVAAAAATTVRCGGVQPYGPRSTTLPSSRSNVSRNVNTRTAVLHSVSCSTSVVNSKKLAVASAAAESRMAGSSSSRAHVLQEKKQAVSQSFRRSVTARTPSATAMMSQRSRTATNTSAVVNTTTPSAAAATEVGKTLFTRSKTLLTAQQQLLRGGKNKSLNAVV